MKWFYNLKIAAKLIVSFIIVALIAGIVGVVGIINIRSINTLDTDMYERHTATMPDLANIARGYVSERVILRNLYMDRDINKRQNYLNEFDKENELVKKSLVEFEKGIKDPTVKKDFEALSKALGDFDQFSTEIINAVQTNQMDAAYSLIYSTRGTEIANTVQEMTDELFSLKTNLAKESSESNNAAAKQATFLMIAVVIAGMVISVLLGLFISRLISKPINKMVEAADLLALGDVNVNVKSDSKDETGKLAESFGKMIDNIRSQAQAAEKIASGDLTVDVAVRSENDLLGKKLHEMVEKNNEILSNIAASSEQVAAGSKQVSDSSVALSQGATEQASSVEQLTASLEEISSQTKLNAQNASQANDLAEVAKSNAVQGNQQMGGMLKAMEDINEASANISNIIKVIDDIAFQTNILALNAAVEAARAGQHGKGFAVVAEEVRNLAARSADAAKETTSMIQSSIKKSEDGTKIAKETADALNKIVDGVDKVANLVKEIAVASNEQATGIGQINQGIMLVSQVVQTNSATSEQSAAASEELSGQAAFLKEMVSRFTLKKQNYSYARLESYDMQTPKLGQNPSERRSISLGSPDEAPVSKEKTISFNDLEFGKY